MRPMGFEILKEDARTHARRGRLTTPHGVVETPVFMDVGTLGTVKALEPRDLKELETQVVLGNTYHLMLRPGADIIAAATKTKTSEEAAATSDPVAVDADDFDEDENE